MGWKVRGATCRVSPWRGTNAVRLDDDPVDVVRGLGGECVGECTVRDREGSSFTDDLNRIATKSCWQRERAFARAAVGHRQHVGVPVVHLEGRGEARTEVPLLGLSIEYGRQLLNLTVLEPRKY